MHKTHSKCVSTLKCTSKKKKKHRHADSAESTIQTHTYILKFEFELFYLFQLFILFILAHFKKKSNFIGIIIFCWLSANKLLQMLLKVKVLALKKFIKKKKTHL